MTCILPHAADKRRRAFAMLEYTIMIIIIAGALLAFRVYLQRAAQGQYRRAGESFAFTRQFNPGASIDCVNAPFDDGQYHWYSRACFNNMVIRDHCNAAADHQACIRAARSKCQIPACDGP